MNDVLRTEARPVAIRQATVFGALRRRLLTNTLQQSLHSSRLRVILIVVCCALIWGAIYGLSAEAFSYLNRINVPLTGGIIGAVFDLMFLALTVLLLFSCGIILYSSLFSAAETSFLLSTPARADQVFAHKFRGAVMFSSWAFLLLSSPMLVAYGIAYGVPWYYYGLLFLYFVGFVLLPGSLGALFCLLIVNFLPRHRRHVLVVSGLAVVAVSAIWVYQLRPNNWHEAVQRDYVQRVLGQLASLQGPLSPNHWLSRGLQAAARGDKERAFYYLTLIWGNGLFLYLVITWTASRLYRRGYDRLAAGGSMRRRYGGAWLDRVLAALLGWFSPQTRLLIIKDFRTFRRDPAQWAQVLIFTGLMVLYFANMRRFFQEELGRSFQNAISLMNLTATGLLLCAYTGRFIYPLLSLEGRKFWILGLLPMRRERLLWGKFAFASTWALLIAEFLVIFSDLMLGVPALIVAVHAFTVATLALGLSGLSVGLGASMPNFRETDPSKIAVGFGGTLNLIVSLMFLLVTIALMSVPWHLRMAFGAESVPLVWPALATGIGLLAGAAATAWALKSGARALRRTEF